MLLSCAVVCGPGKVRETNQDNYFLNGTYRDDPADSTIRRETAHAEDEVLCAVADGMGGEKFGEIASLIAVSSLESFDRGAGTAGFNRYLLGRNEDICRFMLRNKRVRAGSTFVGVHFQDGLADVVNIGDSRAYLFRRGRLTQLSQDHTPLRQLVELGILTPEAARRHPDRHKLTQHLGLFPEELIIEPYARSVQVCAGDMFLLCSDGLYDMLDDGEIGRILSLSCDAGEAARTLFDGAMAAGGKDNITALLIQARP